MSADAGMAAKNLDFAPIASVTSVYACAFEHRDIQVKTYAVIKAEIAKLERQAEALRKSEVAGVVSRIKEAIAAYGLTAADLGLGRSDRLRREERREKAPARKAKGSAKYRDPASGKTWTGQGRPPAWIVDVANRDAFLIQAGDTEPQKRRALRSSPSRSAARPKARAADAAVTKRGARRNKATEAPASDSSGEAAE